ncbi:hypothetical protein DIPPA_08454 [Diplonema papillatum]|nr:hypothetical protein DIPPA_08454 [Diplonema papillatum]
MGCGVSKLDAELLVDSEGGMVTEEPGLLAGRLRFFAGSMRARMRRFSRSTRMSRGNISDDKVLQIYAWIEDLNPEDLLPRSDASTTGSQESPPSPHSCSVASDELMDPTEDLAMPSPKCRLRCREQLRHHLVVLGDEEQRKRYVALYDGSPKSSVDARSRKRPSQSSGRKRASIISSKGGGASVEPQSLSRSFSFEEDYSQPSFGSVANRSSSSVVIETTHGGIRKRHNASFYTPPICGAIMDNANEPWEMQRPVLMITKENLAAAMDNIA